MTLAATLRARALADLGLRRARRADDDGSTVRDARSRKVDAYAALLLTLWARLQSGMLSDDEYAAEVERAFNAALGDIPAGAEETIAGLRTKALAKASDMAERASLADDAEGALSVAQKSNWATMASGALWAATLAAEAYGRQTESDEDTSVSWQTQGDERVCDPCGAMDGETWPSPDDVPFWPGDPSGPCLGMDNCRCEVS